MLTITNTSGQQTVLCYFLVNIIVNKICNKTNAFCVCDIEEVHCSTRMKLQKWLISKAVSRGPCNFY